MASYQDITNILDFSVSFARQGAFPLDKYQMFGSLATAEAAAATAENAGSVNTPYYFGMPLTVFENDQATMYVINGDKTLKQVGAATYGDDKTIILDVNTGKLSLKSFGEEYYAYHAADESHTEAYYELVTGWKEGLSPKVVGNPTDGYALAWYEPSTTTVEGLQDSVATLNTSIETINNQINEVNTSITNNASAIETLNGDETVEGSVKKTVADEIAKIVADAPESLDTLKEISDWISGHASDAAEMNTNITANATAIAALETLVGPLPEGTQATTVMGYIAEAVSAEETRALAAEAALSARITALEESSTNVEASDVNGNIKVDGAEVTVYTAPVASASQAGDVKVDGTSIIATEGTISVNAVDHTKVTGLTDQLDSTKQAAVAEAAAGAAELYLPKTDVVAATDAAASVEAASDVKAASEKMVMSMLTWKTTM